MLRLLRKGWILLLPMLAAAPAAAQAPCPLPGEAPMLVTELFLGRGGVSDEAWRGFLAREVTPRFPDGFTALDAAGQWRDPASGHVARERSMVLIIAAAQSSATLARVSDLAAAYRRLFHQRSVGIVTETECAAF